MYDLLLINPALDEVRERDPSFKFAYVDEGHGYIPLFAVALIPYIRKMGFSVKFLDMELYSDRDEKRLLKEHVPQARIVGVSVMTVQIPQALAITKEVKRISPQTAVVWGGIHGTLLPEQTVAHPLIDHVVCGEGEEPLACLLAGRDHPRIKTKVKRSGIEEHEKFLKMDDLPDPDYDAIEMERYFRFQGGARNCDILTSRGCPYKCTFCVNTIIKNPWRGLSPQRSIGIIRRVHQAHHIKHILFMDENFFGRVGRADEIIRGISDLGITWEANICVKDLLKLDDAFFLLMKKSGVLRLRMGVESASDRMLEIINKGITREQIIAARDRCLSFGITPALSFMTNLPDELPEEQKATFDLADESRKKGAVVIGPQPFRPYPGSIEYQKLVDRGLKIPDSLEGWCATDIFTRGLNAQTPVDKLRLFLKKMFPDGKMRTRIVRRIRKWF